MRQLRALALAFSMYSRIPAPEVEWTEETMAWSLCWFPAVGLVSGGALLAWWSVGQWLCVGSAFFAAGAVLIPLLITGGIHMDGFCDVCDALGSNQSRERKLEIMKDPHIGAFGVMGCCGYLLALFALWCQADLSGEDCLVLALIPALSRTLSAYAALTLPKARQNGLLHAFTRAQHHGGRRTALLAVCFVLCWAVGCLGNGIAAVLAAGAVWFWYRHMALKEFGGVTGDLAGYFLQLCEGGCLLAVVMAQRVVSML